MPFGCSPTSSNTQTHGGCLLTPHAARFPRVMGLTLKLSYDDKYWMFNIKDNDHGKTKTYR